MSGQTANTEPTASAFLPILLMLGAASVLCSLAISQYWGMGLAVLTLVGGSVTLTKSSRSAWNWVVALASIGFCLGLTSLLMQLIVISQQR